MVAGHERRGCLIRNKVLNRVVLDGIQVEMSRQWCIRTGAARKEDVVVIRRYQRGHGGKRHREKKGAPRGSHYLPALRAWARGAPAVTAIASALETRALSSFKGVESASLRTACPVASSICSPAASRDAWRSPVAERSTRNKPCDMPINCVSPERLVHRNKTYSLPARQVCAPTTTCRISGANPPGATTFSG